MSELVKKILFLSANPRQTMQLRVDEELREIKEGLRRAKEREQFILESAEAVRYRDLRRAILDNKHTNIVHFSGHGAGEDGLVFEDESGQVKLVDANSLAGLFKLFADTVECVVLNACYSEVQADAIAQHIPFVVGMRKAIGDKAAIEFAIAFYDAIGSGREDYKFAFDYARNAIDLAGIPESDTPKFLSKEILEITGAEKGKNAIQLEISGSSKMRSAALSEAQRKLEVIEVVTNTSIPEHLKPILKKKTSLNITDSNTTLSQEKRVDIQLVIDKTLEEDANVKQYREQVKEYLSDHILEDYERALLDVLRDELGLSSEKANQIVEEELAPIYKARQAYAIRLKALIKYYPFSEQVKSELKKFQAQWNLTDREVNEISQPILEQAEIAYQETLQPQPIVTPAPTSSILLSARGIDYSELEELLKQQKWKEADEVTFKGMLEVANRSSDLPFAHLRKRQGNKSAEKQSPWE